MKNNSHSSSSSYSFHKDTHNTKRKFASYSVFYNGDHKNNFYNTTLVAEDKKHDNDIHGEQQQQEEEKTKGRFSVDYHDVATTNTTTHQSSQQPRKRTVASSTAVPSSSVDISSEAKNASINMMDHNSIKGAGAGPGKATARATNKKSRSWSLNIRALILPSAIGIWYILGVLSISTTKILLTNYESMGMTPSILTLQQLFIGMIILRLWMMLMTRHDKSNCPIHLNLKKIISISYNQKESDTLGYFELLSSGIFFTLGFLFTNLSFSAADASFVETIKASEPISSAGLSVLWKLETMSQQESYSLLGICVGVVISTVGNAHGANDNDHPMGGIRPSMMQSFRSSAIVMGSNLCFSFRSLYQKLFRASPMGRPSVVNDVSLQYLIHQIGVMVMTVLVILLDASSLLAKLYESISTGGILFSDQMGRFMLLSVVNGLAFTHYNLASSYILSRISVVTHAALNCIRRLFAIVMTSIIFSVPISIISGLGIAVSISNFLLYTRFKAERKSMMQHPHHSSSSILPP